MTTTKPEAPRAVPPERAEPRAPVRPPWAGSWLRGQRLIPVLALAAGLLFSGAVAADDLPSIRNNLPIRDGTGAFATSSTAGVVDTSNPFFQSLGTNGRSCATCHIPAEAWSITPRGVQRRFAATGGTDPIFRTNDGANAPNLDVSTVAARRRAYSMLLSKGVIRVGIAMPIGSTSEITLTTVSDPYGFASASQLSLFRRPLPATNLGFLSAVLWDGRDTGQPLLPGNTPALNTTNLAIDLAHQANNATLGHAQAVADLTPEQQQLIVNFERGLSTAQIFDDAAGHLTAGGALGGPVPLANQSFFIGSNDPLGANPTGAPFTPSAFTLYNAWSGSSIASRAAVARGQTLFNIKPINITGVGGLNDDRNVAMRPGTCTTCHDTPNVGNHSVSTPLNIGIADVARNTGDLPVYTLTCTVGTTNIEGTVVNGVTTVQTTDPGRALISGKCKDIGRFKVPILRALPARAPYFHNGSAATLTDVVTFYNTRFGIGFTPQEQADLVAFLRTL